MGLDCHCHGHAGPRGELFKLRDDLINDIDKLEVLLKGAKECLASLSLAEQFGSSPEGN